MMGMVLMKKLKWWMWVLLCVFLIFTLLIFTNSLPPPGYQTTDVSLYRVYPKRFDVKIVELAHRVFPAEIEEHYKKFGDHLPEELRAQLETLKKNLA